MSDQNNRVYSTMETGGNVVDGYVPVSELQELVAHWRWENAQPAGQQGAYEVAEAFEKTADDVEELIEQYE